MSGRPARRRCAKANARRRCRKKRQTLRRKQGSAPARSAVRPRRQRRRMTSLAVAADVDPLESPELRRRFPHLDLAMDAEFMRTSIQKTLFAGGESHPLELERPKAEVSEDSCWLQYELRSRTKSGV